MGIQAQLAGAVGFILCNAEVFEEAVAYDIHVIPAAHLSYKNGTEVFKYVNNTK